MQLTIFMIVWHTVNGEYFEQFPRQHTLDVQWMMTYLDIATSNRHPILGREHPILERGHPMDSQMTRYRIKMGCLEKSSI